MEPLKERPDKVEDKKHLLLSFDQGGKPIFHQIKQTTDLKKNIAKGTTDPRVEFLLPK